MVRVFDFPNGRALSTLLIKQDTSDEEAAVVAHFIGKINSSAKSGLQIAADWHESVVECIGSGYARDAVMGVNGKFEALIDSLEMPKRVAADAKAEKLELDKGFLPRAKSAGSAPDARFLRGSVHDRPG
jgi:hypothetical protein